MYHKIFVILSWKVLSKVGQCGAVLNNATKVQNVTILCIQPANVIIIINFLTKFSKMIILLCHKKTHQWKCISVDRAYMYLVFIRLWNCHKRNTTLTFGKSEAVAVSCCNINNWSRLKFINYPWPCWCRIHRTCPKAWTTTPSKHLHEYNTVWENLSWLFNSAVLHWQTSLQRFHNC